MRKDHPDVHQQPWQVVLVNPKQDAIVMGKKGAQVYFLLINRSEKPVVLDIPVGDTVQCQNMLTRETYSAENGRLIVSTAPVSALLLSPESKIKS